MERFFGHKSQSIANSHSTVISIFACDSMYRYSRHNFKVFKSISSREFSVNEFFTQRKKNKNQNQKKLLVLHLTWLSLPQHKFWSLSKLILAYQHLRLALPVSVEGFLTPALNCLASLNIETLKNLQLILSFCVWVVDEMWLN